VLGCLVEFGGDGYVFMSGPRDGGTRWTRRKVVRGLTTDEPHPLKNLGLNSDRFS
jgi:hypothetical protein